MYQRLLPVLYAIEFLIALIAVFTVWREVGGAGHLDYMQWYWKILIGVPAAYVAVRLTKALGGGGWNYQTMMWMLALVGLAAAALVVTYYTHLSEPIDEDDEDPGSITPTVVRRARGVADRGGTAGDRPTRSLRGV